MRNFISATFRLSELRDYGSFAKNARVQRLLDPGDYQTLKKIQRLSGASDFQKFFCKKNPATLATFWTKILAKNGPDAHKIPEKSRQKTGQNPEFPIIPGPGLLFALKIKNNINMPDSHILTPYFAVCGVFRIGGGRFLVGGLLALYGP